MIFGFMKYKVLGIEQKVLCRKYYGYQILAVRVGSSWIKTTPAQKFKEIQGEWEEIPEEEALIVMYELGA